MVFVFGLHITDGFSNPDLAGKKVFDILRQNIQTICRVQNVEPLVLILRAQSVRKKKSCLSLGASVELDKGVSDS